MASVFETFFAAHAMPILRSQFDKEVDMINGSGAEVRFAAMVDLDEIPAAEGFADLQGRVSIKTSDLTEAINPDGLGSWLKCRYRGELFDVYASMPDDYGSTVFNIRRRYEEQQQSNLFDVSGRQIPFA